MADFLIKYPSVRPNYVKYDVPSEYRVEKISSVTVTTPLNPNDKYDSLVDPRFGATGNGSCVSCRGDSSECQSHSGIIKTNAPFIIPSHQQTFFSIISMFCLKCGMIKDSKVQAMSDEVLAVHAAIHKAQRIDLKQIKSSMKNVTKKSCSRCNSAFVKLEMRDGMIIEKKAKKKDAKDTLDRDKEENWSYRDLHVLCEAVKTIPMKYIAYLNTTHPYRMMLSHNLYVPGIRIRLDKSVRLAHSFTLFLEIFRASNDKILKAKTPLERIRAQEAAQLDLNNYESSTGIKFNCAPAESLTFHHTGKSVMRRFILATRALARSLRQVIINNSNIPPGYVSIDRIIAQAIKCCRVHIINDNLEEIKILLSSLHKYTSYFDVYSQTQYMLDGQPNPNIQLKAGSYLERPLETFDRVLFTRNPALHPNSVVAVSLICSDTNPYNTRSCAFGMNPSLCGPYNADFDGDEMNIFEPSTTAALVEMNTHMAVEENTISKVTSAPEYGCTQTHIIGMRLFTKDNPPHDVVMRCIGSVMFMALQKPPMDKLKNKTMSAFDALSLFLPPKLTTTRSPVKIVNGKVISTTVWDKQQVGAGQMNSIQRLVYEHTRNQEDILALTHVFNKIGGRYTAIRGYSIKLGDIILSKQERFDLRDEVFNSTEKVYSTLNQFTFNAYKDKSVPKGFVNSPATIKAVDDELETLITTHTMQTYNQLIKNSESRRVANDYIEAIEAGTKLSPYDLRIFFVAIGQQRIADEKIARIFNDRTYAVYPRYTQHPEAFGFSRDSLFGGQDIISSNNSGGACKYACVAVVCNTADSGYRMRQGIKHTEDAIVNTPGSVIHHSTRNIIQYAVNGFRMEMMNTITLRLIDYKSQPIVDKDILPVLQRTLELLDKALIVPSRQEKSKNLIFVCDPEILISKYDEGTEDVLDFTEHYRFIDRLNYEHYYNSSPITVDVMRYIMLTYFHPSLLGKRKDSIGRIFDHLFDLFLQSFDGGSPIGICYAQYIQERFTQAQLGTFHRQTKIAIGESDTNYIDTARFCKPSSKKRKGYSITVFSKNRSKLSAIRKLYNFITLELFDPTVTLQYSPLVVNNIKYNFKILIEIEYYMFEKNDYETDELLGLIQDYVGSTTDVLASNVSIDVADNIIRYTFWCDFVDPIERNAPLFAETLVYNIHKGDNSNQVSDIQEVHNFHDSFGELHQSIYGITLIVQAIDTFGKIDMSDCFYKFHDNFGVWSIYQCYGMMQTQTYIQQALVEGFSDPYYAYPLCSLIAAIMCQHSFYPMPIDSYRLDGSNLKQFGFEKPKYILVKAAQRGDVDPIVDNSSRHTLNMPCILGPCYDSVHFDFHVFENTPMQGIARDVPVQQFVESELLV